MGSNSLSRDWTPEPLHWECGVLASGPPGKSQSWFFSFSAFPCSFWFCCRSFLASPTSWKIDLYSASSVLPLSGQLHPEWPWNEVVEAVGEQVFRGTSLFPSMIGTTQSVKGSWGQEVGNPGGDTVGDSGNISRGRWPRSPQSERNKHTEPREAAKAHVGLFFFLGMSLLLWQLNWDRIHILYTSLTESGPFCDF